MRYLAFRPSMIISVKYCAVSAVAYIEGKIDWDRLCAAGVMPDTGQTGLSDTTGFSVAGCCTSNRIWVGEVGRDVNLQGGMAVAGQSPSFSYGNRLGQVTIDDLCHLSLAGSA